MPIVNNGVEDAPRRYNPVGIVIAILAAIVAIAVGYVAIFGNPFASSNKSDGYPSDKPVHYSEYMYQYAVTQDDIITRVTAPGGKVIFDEGWSDKDTVVVERDFIREGDMVPASLSGVAATLALPEQTVEGTTILKVSMSTDNLVELVRAYNAIDMSETKPSSPESVPAPPEPRLAWVDYPTRYILETVLHGNGLGDDTSIRFAVEGEPYIESKPLIVDLYDNGDGYPAWEVALTTKDDFSYDNTYEYNFTCARYTVVTGDNAATIEGLQSVLPELDLAIAVTTVESSGEGIFFWNGGSYRMDTKEPCGITTTRPAQTPPPKESEFNPPPEEDGYGY